MKIETKISEDYGEHDNLVRKAQYADIFQLSSWREVSSGKTWKDTILLQTKQDNEVVISGFLYSIKSKLFGKYLYLQHGPIFSDKILDISNSFKNSHANSWGNYQLNSVGEKAFKSFLEELKTYAKQTKHFAILAEPLLRVNTIPDNILRKSGYTQQKRGVLPKYPMFMDLNTEEEDLMENMKKGHRYNVRYAERQEVEIEFVYPTKDNSEIVEKAYEIISKVSDRKDYDVPNIKFFKNAWKTYEDTKNVAIGIAKFEGEILSVNFTQFFEKWAGSYYTANKLKHRKKRASYLLKWQTILEAKRNGCKVFDMWGWIPGLSKEDSEYGYGRFKKGFMPIDAEFSGRLNLAINPVKYAVWKNAGEIIYSIKN